MHDSPIRYPTEHAEWPRIPIPYVASAQFLGTSEITLNSRSLVPVTKLGQLFWRHDSQMPEEYVKETESTLDGVRDG